MWDKADIRIPFAYKYVQVLKGDTEQGEPMGIVDVSLYDFPAFASVAFIDGQKVYESPKAQTWSSIPSSISNVAIGFFPEGNGFYPWPHVSLKASPTKILQGHNVFGSEDIRQGVMQMLGNLQQAFPKISNHLDFKSAEVRYLDSTYSITIDNDQHRQQVISLFERLFDKESVSRYEGYLQGNKFSEYRRQKVYYKLGELLADLEGARRKRQIDKVAILSDQRLQDFANGRMRFEATTGYRAMLRDGIPTNLFEFLKFHDWFEKTHKQPLAQYLWHKAFDKYLSQFQGHTMKNVDDAHIKLKINAKYTVIKDDGKICRRRANAVFNTYRQIKGEGYSYLAKEKSKTFFRNVNFLIEAGISRGFLKSLDPTRPLENSVSLVEVITVDFSQQRPDWYVEPVAGYDDQRRHLRLVG